MFSASGSEISAGKAGRTVFLHLVLIVSVSVALFANTLNNQFVWDDWGFLLATDSYRSLNIVSLLTSPGNGVEYLPVRDLSYVIDTVLWGGNPFGFHLTNLILYALNCVAVYFLANSACALLTGGGNADPAPARRVALVTSLLFALHPIHSEAVSFITGRNTLLSGLFTFWSAQRFMHYLMAADQKSWRNLLLSFALYLLAIFSKGTSIFLPVMLAALVPFGRGDVKMRRYVTLTPFFFAAAAAFFLFTSIARKSGVIDPVMAAHGGLLASHIAIALQIPFFYLYKILVPLALSPEYDVVFTPTMVSVEALSALAILALSAAAVVLNRIRWHWIYFGTCWFASALLPVLHLLPTATTVSDRYAYLPSFGLLFILAYWFTKIPGNRTVGSALIAMILIVLGLLSYRQNRVWRTDETLWRYTVSVSPDSVKAQVNLGNIFFSRGDYNTAMAHFLRAQEIAPADPSYDFHLGFLLLENGRAREALEQFERALAKDRNYIDALYHSGLACEQLQGPDCGQYYRRVIATVTPDVLNFRSKARERLKNPKGT